MAVQYSIQKMVSDGTLSTVALGIQYLQRNDVYIRLAGEETPQSGASSGYTWSFVNNTTLKILPVVPNGVEVVVYRRTDVDAMYNIYSQNAQFDEATTDENNQQLLYIAQEYLEQGIPGAGVDTIEFLRDDGVNTYYRVKRTDGSYSTEFAVPSVGTAVYIIAREATRRSYAIAGFNLVTGSFEVGFTLVNDNDVVLHEGSGKAFSGPLGSYPAGTSTVGFIDKSALTPGAGVIRDGRFALRDSVSISNYGAKGDGVSDDTLALQKAVNTGRGVLIPSGSYRITSNIDFSSVGNIDIFSAFTDTTIIVELPSGVTFLSNKDYTTRGETKVCVQGLQFRSTNPLSRLFYTEKTYSPVLFEDLTILDSVNVFDFVDLYGNPTVRRIKVRNSDTLGGAGDFLFRAKGCNTFVLDNFTGNAGAYDGILFLNNDAGTANYSNSINNVTIQGSASINKRALYYQGGDCTITNLYEEGRSSTQSVFLDGVRSAKLGAIHMTGGSVHAKDSNVFISSVTFLKTNASKAEISALTSDNSNIVIGVINNNQDYDYRFERESSGSITLLKDKNLRGRPIATKRLTQQNPINSDAVVTTDTTLASLGIDFRYKVVTNGNSDTGIRLVVDGSANLPAGTRITAIARITTTDSSLVRMEKNSGDITARYYFPTSTRCDKQGDHVCILHLVATGNSFNGNINIKTTAATTFYIYGEVYPGWIYTD